MKKRAGCTGLIKEVIPRGIEEEIRRKEQRQQRQKVQM